MVVGGVFGEELAAGVFDGEGGLGEEETFFGGGFVDAAAVVLGDNHLVVGFGLVAEEGELEAILAVERAVAGTAVAAVFGEDGKDVGGEALLGGLIGLLDEGGGGGGEALELGLDFGGAVGLGGDLGLVERGGGAGDSEGGFAGYVLRFAARAPRPG